ncbi:hypothetical protein DOY81_005467 [Sarcophaga bullata]|nr:hypothetical protein DOY81_005467 [Sarcophaga bullata]
MKSLCTFNYNFIYNIHIANLKTNIIDNKQTIYLPLILSSTVEFNSSNLSISAGINSSLDSSLVQVETSTRNCKRILSSSDMVVAELMA